MRTSGMLGGMRPSASPSRTRLHVEAALDAALA